MLTIPRVIGIILIIIGLLTFSRFSGSFLLFIAGLVLLLAKSAQRHLDSFIKSFNDGKIIATTALFDSLFWMLLFGTGGFYMWILSGRAEAIQAAQVLSKDALLDPAKTELAAAAVKEIALLFIVGLSILAIINLFSYTFFRSLTYTSLTNSKFTKAYFKKFLITNSIWWILWGIPIFLFAAAKSQTNAAKVAIAFTLILGTYFTLFVHCLFAKKQSPSYALGHGIAYGIIKIPSLIVPFIYSFTLYLIIYQIFQLFQYWPSRALQAVSILFVILYLAWLRTYLYPIISGFKEE